MPILASSPELILTSQIHIINSLLWAVYLIYNRKKSHELQLLEL